jgi:thymidylate synthase
MKQYLDSLQHIIDTGKTRTDRTGVGTIGIFGYQMRYDLQKGFPAVTTKRLAWKSVVSELLWFLEGSTDERRLAEILYGTRDPKNTTIWTDNALHQGVALGYEYNDMHRELGPIYSKQWRDVGGVDQIHELIVGLRENPYSRRHILNAWNVAELSQMALPPCHILAQFYVDAENNLSCHLYQRSADAALGVPFNIASYSLLTHILASITGLGVGEFIHSIGDYHIYSNHIDGVKEQLARLPGKMPTLSMPTFSTLGDVLGASVDDFKLVNYNPQPTIKFKMAV